MNQIEIELKYEGYIKRQEEQVRNFDSSESEVIPEKFDFSKIKSLSTEAREKLNKVKPSPEKALLFQRKAMKQKRVMQNTAQRIRKKMRFLLT